MADLLSRFVKVRITAMDGVDLRIFQFDFDMTWAALFLNADGTVYGRFGTRDGTPEQAEELISTAAFKHAMTRALELHDGYPENRAELEGKQSRKLGWNTVDDIPVTRRNGFGGCYHCHHVAEGLSRAPLERNEPLPDSLLWPYPTADHVGLTLDVDAGHRVTAVADGSLADAAGLRPSDVIERIDGQAILSHADLQWVLHHAPDEGALAVDVRRDDTRETLELSLHGDWRRGDTAWRESRWSIRPGFQSHRLDAVQRERRDLEPSGMALRVGAVFGRGVRKGGVIRNDVIVAVDGVTDDWSEDDLIAAIRQRYRVGDRVPLEVIRRGARIELELLVP